jgi:predicted O-methyltransferase YrrM
MIKRKPIMPVMMKRIINRGLRLPHQILKRQKAKHALTRLSTHSDQKLRAIGQAIQESVDGEFSLQEEKAILSIEERRSFLLSSDEEIPVIDYGAGSPNSDRTREEMVKGVRSTARIADITNASKSQFWAKVLFKIIRKLEPQSCFELGSCVGVSASYQASALKLNGKGKLVTLEGSPAISNIANETFASLEIGNASIVTGPFHETLSDTLESSKPIDFFFNDGHHDHDAVLQYFNLAMPFLSNDAIIVFDDISWSPGMREAWLEIENDERVSASIDLSTIGIVLVNRTLIKKERFEIPL